MLDASIIIPVHNQLEHLKNCLASIWETTCAPIIIVNDGSDQETSDYVDYAVSSGLVYKQIKHHKPLGFSASVNAGMKQVETKWYCLLNSDTIIGTKDWMFRFMDAGKADEKVGIMSCLSNYAFFQSIPKKAANNILTKEDIPIMSYLVSQYTEQRHPQLKFINGFCYWVRNEVKGSVGLFDVKRFPHYGSEDDYTIRSQKYLWKTICLDDVFIWHKGSASYADNRKVMCKNAFLQLELKHSRIKIREGLSGVGDELDYIRQKIVRLIGGI